MHSIIGVFTNILSILTTVGEQTLFTCLPFVSLPNANGRTTVVRIPCTYPRYHSCRPLFVRCLLLFALPVTWCVVHQCRAVLLLALSDQWALPFFHLG